jgi:hypothetical protein
MSDDTDLELVDWLALEVPLWTDRSKVAVEQALALGVPPDGLAAFARWWQLEAWLRFLVHLELRSRDGVRWIQGLPSRSRQLARRDSENAYMASVDAVNPLSYLDAGELLELIGSPDVWSIVRYALLKRTRWDGLVDELQSIRNRNAHLRRPHRDDLTRLEQALRNLESGARSALESLNRTSFYPKDPRDPVATGWIERQHDDAKRLIEHARRQYDTMFSLSYSSRPWARVRVKEPISNQPGVLIHARWFARGDAAIWPREFWQDGYLDQDGVRDMIVLVTHSSDADVAVTFSAADDPNKIADAIGVCFDVALNARDRHPTPERRRNWRLDAVGLDWRVHTDDVVAVASDDQPFSIFGA